MSVDRENVKGKVDLRQDTPNCSPSTGDIVNDTSVLVLPLLSSLLPLSAAVDLIASMVNPSGQWQVLVGTGQGQWPQPWGDGAEAFLTWVQPLPSASMLSVRDADEVNLI